MKRLVFAVIVALAAGCPGGQAGAGPTTPAQKVQPKISMEDARAIALAKVPGTIDHEKLKVTKKEAVYSFKIVPTGGSDPNVLTKIEIDGTTGAVLKVKDVKRKDKNDKKDKGKGDDDDD